MSRAPLPSDDRLLDLLAQRATEGLSPVEQAELDRLLAAHRAQADPGLDVAAAALAASFARAEAEPLPDSLRRRLRAAAPASTTAPPAHQAPTIPPPPVAGRLIPAGALGWLAAAACLLLAVFFWSRVARVTAPTPYEQVAAAADAIQLDWAPGPDALGQGVTGQVVWSDDLQSGWMIFRNLPPLDPASNDYQLWIFDPSRDTHPVDGGVFNIDRAAAEVRVPIRARLRVDQPTLFAVTVEKPGGVVVSDQSRIALVAPVGG